MSETGDQQQGAPHVAQYCWLLSVAIVVCQKLVISNKELLAQLRTSFDRPEVMRELFRKLVSK